jgi:hypothetical protein
LPRIIWSEICKRDRETKCGLLLVRQVLVTLHPLFLLNGKEVRNNPFIRVPFLGVLSCTDNPKQIKLYTIGELWGNVLEGTSDEDEGKKAQSTERKHKAIRVNTSLAWMSRRDNGLGIRDRLWSGW